MRIHDELFAGERVRIRGPRNHFAFEVAPRYRFVAGGIGITAILPMVRAAAARGADWSLAYGGRTVEGMAFAAELAREYPDRVALFPSGRPAAWTSPPSSPIPIPSPTSTAAVRSR